MIFFIETWKFLSYVLRLRILFKPSIQLSVSCCSDRGRGVAALLLPGGNRSQAPRPELLLIRGDREGVPPYFWVRMRVLAPNLVPTDTGRSGLITSRQ